MTTELNDIGKPAPDCQPNRLLEGIKPHHLRDTKKSLLHGVPDESISDAFH